MPRRTSRSTRADAAAAATDTAFAAAFPPPTNTPIISNVVADTQGVDTATTIEVVARVASTRVAVVAPPEVHDFTGTTQSVEDSHIVTNTRNTYNRTLTDFMLYLFTNSNAKLVNIAPLTAAKVVDDARSTPKQREAKRSFRKECGNQLRRMNRIERN